MEQKVFPSYRLPNKIHDWNWKYYYSIIVFVRTSFFKKRKIFRSCD